MANTLQTKSGTIKEIGHQSSAFIGSRYAYVRLADDNGGETDLTGIVVLNQMDPLVKVGSRVTLVYDRCWFSDVVFGLKSDTKTVVSTDVGPIQYVRFIAYGNFAAAIGLTVISLGLLLPVAAIFGGIGWFVWTACKTPKPEEVTAALGAPAAA